MPATATALPQPNRLVAWSGLGDDQLGRRAAAGDHGAFTTLYERYYGPLLGYTRSILLDAEDARDATQNALEKALRALPDRDDGRPLRPWLYKIAHNEAIDIMRRRRPQTELAPGLEPTVPGPEVDAEQRGRLSQLVDDLRTLPERQRGALVMRELNGLSYEEIGSALGLTNEAARRAVFDARNSLHAAADGRATECVSVRHSISDGDRRSLRARGIRAHLRSCDDCASFQRAIGARSADLHMLAPWVSGAAVLGALGAGGAGGGGALLAGGASTASGGAISWASLPMAIKSAAVVAAVATTGTAAVEIKHAAGPARSPAISQTVQPRSAHADAVALRAAALAARTAVHQRVTTAALPGAGTDVHTTGGTRSSSHVVSTAGKQRSNAPALAPPTTVPAVVAPPAATLAPQAPANATTTPAAAPHATSPIQTAIAQLGPLTGAVQQAFSDAQSIAAGGTQSSLALATSMLDRTLGPLRSAIDDVLAPLGLSLPASAPAPTTSSSGSLTGVLAPVQQVLGSVQNLLAGLIGQHAR